MKKDVLVNYCGTKGDNLEKLKNNYKLFAQYFEFNEGDSLEDKMIYLSQQGDYLGEYTNIKSKGKWDLHTIQLKKGKRLEHISIDKKSIQIVIDKKRFKIFLSNADDFSSPWRD